MLAPQFFRLHRQILVYQSNNTIFFFCNEYFNYSFFKKKIKNKLKDYFEYWFFDNLIVFAKKKDELTQSVKSNDKFDVMSTVEKYKVCDPTTNNNKNYKYKCNASSKYDKGLQRVERRREVAISACDATRNNEGLELRADWQQCVFGAQLRRGLQRRYPPLEGKSPKECEEELETPNEHTWRGVVTMYNYRTYMAEQFDWNKSVDSPMDSGDDNDDDSDEKSKKKTFREYYHEKGYDRFATKPGTLSAEKGLLLCRDGLRFQKSKAGKKIYLIPELCRFTGVSLSQSQDRAFMSEVHERCSPSFREWIMQAKQIIAKLNQEFEHRKLGFSISSDPITVENRVLERPEEVINYISNSKGGGKIAQGKGFVETKSTLVTQDSSFNIIVLAEDEDVGYSVAEQTDRILEEEQRYRGVALHNEIYLCDLRNVVECHKVLNWIVNQNIHGVLVIMTNQNESTIYANVQSWARKAHEKRELAIQCIKQRVQFHSLDLWDQFNEALQLSKKTMIVGMDVCHNRKARESVVGFASTFDSDFVRVHQFIGIQEMGKELVTNINKYFECALDAFQKDNDTFPDQIIFYRDGVSVSQLDQIKKEEISELKQVLQQKMKGKACNLEFIVVQKRVKTRFFAENEAPVVPGTVVDDLLSGPQVHEFFIVPCPATQKKKSNPKPVSNSKLEGTVVSQIYPCVLIIIGQKLFFSFVQFKLKFS
ncbi:hypothetical protein RFI_29768 [Reticulomyxa filosa]|uniref:Piwi domain-containing protein n=1 Tax=Reticulomyxa filosa TaxID=46433 RepID=X6M1Z6_RETFI|nr:hypothetical protein RFI_29768 [Reticulomyxa filosa]|eukprot:ETO07626.1 hypothetical protein RFI_29768 [Reticulomyxa filosa]